MLLDQFSAENITKYLVHHKEKINLGWIIRNLLEIFYDEDTKASERVMILDRFKEYIILGAMQDADLIARMQGAVSEATPHKDPFAGGSKTLKLSREA